MSYLVISKIIIGAIGAVDGWLLAFELGEIEFGLAVGLVEQGLKVGLFVVELMGPCVTVLLGNFEGEVVGLVVNDVGLGVGRSHVWFS
jgi:hypothetical protein